MYQLLYITRSKRFNFNCFTCDGGNVLWPGPDVIDDWLLNFVCLSGGPSPSIEARIIRGYEYLPASGTGAQNARWDRYSTLAFVCTSPPGILA